MSAVKKGDIMRYNGTTYAHFGQMCTVLEPTDMLGMVCVAFNNYPNVNHREYHNRVYVDVGELEMFVEPIAAQKWLAGKV